MPTKQQLESALVNADNAGDVEGARALANALKRGDFTQEQAEVSPAEGFKTNLQFATPFGTVDTGLELPESVSKTLAGVGSSFEDTLLGAKQILSSGERSKELEAEAEQKRAIDAPLMDTAAGAAGSFIGDVAQTAVVPFAGGVRGAALLGGAFAGTRPVAEGESRAVNTGVGFVLGGATQKALNKIGKGIKKIAKPKTIDGIEARNIQEAVDAGINLDAAQQTGSKTLQRAKSQLSKLPGFADAEAAKFGKQQKQFNRRVLSQAGIKGDTASEEVIDGAFDTLGKKFNDLASKTKVKVDDEVISRLARIEAEASEELTGEQFSLFQKQLEKVVSSGDEISGELYQSIRTTLGSRSRSFLKSSDKGNVGRLVADVMGVLDDQAAKSLPAAQREAWKQARKQYASLVLLTDKGLINELGDISTGKLFNTVKNSNKRAFARGKLGELQKLGRIGKTLQTKIADSGTASNQATQLALAGGAPVLTGLGTLMAGGSTEDALKNSAGALAAVGISRAVGQKLVNSQTLAKIITGGTRPQKALSKVLAAIENESGSQLSQAAKKSLMRELRAIPVIGATDVGLSLAN